MLQFVEALRGLYVSEEAEGQGLVEYALIIAFIAVVVIVAMVFLRTQITSLFSRVGEFVCARWTGRMSRGRPAGSRAGQTARRIWTSANRRWPVALDK